MSSQVPSSAPSGHSVIVGFSVHEIPNTVVLLQQLGMRGRLSQFAEELARMTARGDRSLDQESVALAIERLTALSADLEHSDKPKLVATWQPIITKLCENLKACTALPGRPRSSGFFVGFFRKKFGVALTCVLGAAALLPIAYNITRESSQEIDFPYEGRTFSLDDLTLEEKVAQLMHGSAYGSRTADLMDRVLNHRTVTVAPDFTDWMTDPLKSDATVGGVHLFRSDARSFSEAQRTVREVMANSTIPPFVSMDVVGGYTRHLGITHADAERYGVPPDFLALARAHGLELPSQEDLGRAYESLKTPAEKVQFRLNMELYGAAIGRLCRDLGITINFAPVMDLVVDKDGANFMEKNDEAYSDQILTVLTLSFHYIKGFQQVSGLMIAPKHFAGTGKMMINPHDDDDQGVTDMQPYDGSILPFEDAIHGSLFHSRISSAHKFDAKLRRFFLDIERLQKRLESAQRLENPSEIATTGLLLDQKKVDLEAFLTERNISLSLIGEDFFRTRPIRGMMVGHAQNFMNPEVPGTLSAEMVQRRLIDNLGFDGIVWSDDLSMGAITAYQRKNSGGCTPDVNPAAELFHGAASVGVTMPMLLHHTDDLPEVVAHVRTVIATEADFDHDGSPDITMQMIDDRVRQVLDQKADLGLLRREQGSEGVTYTNTARAYLDHQ